MLTIQRLGFAALSCLMTAPSLADELKVTPMAVIDAVAYGDDAGGRGTEYLQNANGIFNVHSDNGDGHSHGGGLDRGLNLRGVELGLRAEWEGVLDGAFRFATDGKAGELEEFWLRTDFLPAGLRLKGGRFYSDVGQQNNLHPHEWDFVDQALPYQMLFAGGLRGNGLQFDWSPRLPFDLRLGVEALSGGNEGVAAYVGPTQGYLTTTGKRIDVPFEGDKDWPRVWTTFLKSGFEPAEGHHVFGGLSYIKGRQHQELHTYHPGINDADHALEGETWTAGLDLGYHRHAGGTQGEGDFKLSAEYYYQSKDLTLTYHDTKPWNIGMPRELHVDAFVVQALYGIAPRWEVGLRYDLAGHTHEAVRSGSPLYCLPPYQDKPCPRQTSEFEEMNRLSAVATWRIDARQKLRLQLSRAHVPVAEDVDGDGRFDAVRKSFNQVFLQYQLMLGSAPAHHDHGH
jgi:hypothetical protein